MTTVKICKKLRSNSKSDYLESLNRIGDTQKKLCYINLDEAGKMKWRLMLQVLNIKVPTQHFEGKLSVTQKHLFSVPLMLHKSKKTLGTRWGIPWMECQPITGHNHKLWKTLDRGRKPE